MLQMDWEQLYQYIIFKFLKLFMSRQKNIIRLLALFLLFGVFLNYNYKNNIDYDLVRELQPQAVILNNKNRALAEQLISLSLIEKST